MDKSELKNILEALLMSSDDSLTVDAMLGTFEPFQKPSVDVVKHCLRELTADYSDRGIELKLLANGYRFQTQQKYGAWIARLLGEKPVKYSSALLEVLAIIAYRQPVTRADIESIRGVSSSSSLFKTMLERNWIRTAGHRDVPGKPAVYVTTKDFLDYFNLLSLDELPQLGVLPNDK